MSWGATDVAELLVMAGVVITSAIVEISAVRDLDPESHWGRVGPESGSEVPMLESCWVGRKRQQEH